MRKKFTLGGLTQLKIAQARSDDGAAKVVLPLTSDMSPPPSPHPGRRPPLPSKVQSDLRAACAGVLENLKPSHTYYEEQARPARPQLDYEAIKNSVSQLPDAARSVPSNHRRSTRHFNVDAPELVDLRDSIDPSKFAYKPDTALEDLFPVGNSTHDAVQVAALRKGDGADFPPPARSASRSISHTVPINIAPVHADGHDRSRAAHRTASHDTSRSTPHTDVTEYPWSVSTAPTSAGVTPARASKRASAHLQAEQDSLPKTDAAAIVWMRAELEKRRQNQPTPHVRKPSGADKIDTRPPSRARSITKGIKEYIRPSTAGGGSRESSRPASRSGSRASHHSESDRPSSSHGWRSWGLSRKDGVSGDLSRSDSTRGRSETRKGSSKTEINLNRELPPLPSLDKWKEPEPAKPNHVASMWTRSKSRHQQKQTGARQAVSEKDEIVAARLGSPITMKPDVYRPSQAQTSRQTVSAGLVVAKTTGLDLDAAEAELGRQYTSNGLVPTNTRVELHSRNTSDNSEKPHELSRKLRDASSSQGNFDNFTNGPSRNRSVNYSRARPTEDASKSLPVTAPGFSQHRKYHLSDIPQPLNSDATNHGLKPNNPGVEPTTNSRYRNVVEISPMAPPPVPPKDEKKPWWQFKSKQKKPMTWMDQLEKMGIRDGVLLNDESCPVVRY